MIVSGKGAPIAYPHPTGNRYKIYTDISTKKAKVLIGINMVKTQNQEIKQ